MSDRDNSKLTFLESDFDDTISLNGYDDGSNMNSFDAAFKEAVDMLETKTINYFMDINQLVKNPDIMQAFKEAALSSIKEESADRAMDPESWGSYGNMYNNISRLWDNCTDDFKKESTTVGQLMPIKAIDYPILVKQHVALATKDIIETEVVTSPVVKKQLEQTWVVDNQDPSQRWRYPQCFYSDDYKDIFNAGKGYPIKDTAVELPIYNYDVVANLTDAPVPERENFTIDLQVVAAITEDDQEIPMNMYIDLHHSVWLGGKIDTKDSTGAPIQDTLVGEVDFIGKRVSITSLNGKIKKVKFAGYLSNEKNERAVSFDYTREEREWKIEDGHRVDIPYSIEQLDDHKALLNIDLYKKTYDNMSGYLTQMEDSKNIEYLDAEFDRWQGIEVDPLLWNGFVRFIDFNCDSTNITTALPSEFIEKQLKWTIDRFIIDLTNTAKMEDMTFTMYGNPKYVSLLGKNVDWKLSSGSSTAGIKHNYQYGAMSTNGVKINVVSALKFDEKKTYHRGLRVIPVSLRKEEMTFKHFKYTTHILNAKDSAYKAPDLPGGSYTNLVGTSRYTNASVQAIQGQITFSNADFIDSTMTRKPTTTP